MRGLLCALLAIALLGAGLLPMTALAADPAFIYMAKDPAKQYTAQDCEFGCGLTENYVSYKWTFYYANRVVYWWAETDLRDEAEEALENWMDEIPDLIWEEKQSEQDAHVVFLDHDVPANFGPAAINMAWWVDDSYKNASYWLKAEIWLDHDDYTWDSDDAKGQAMAHEIGHLYGLHDRYRTNPVACNPNDDTVMDAMTGTGTTVTHQCDYQKGPTEDDVARVDAYYGEGNATDWTATVNGSVITYKWKDQSWAETWYNLQMFYWNGSSWVYFTQYNDWEDEGLHKDFPNDLGNYYLQTTVDRTQYGAPAGWHCIGGWPYMVEYDVMGDWTSSSAVWVQ